LTLIVAANCIDGLFIIPDRKITFKHKPPEYVDHKVTSNYYPILIGYAGDIQTANNFVERAYLEAQSKSYESHSFPKPQENWKNSVTSGVVQINLARPHDYSVEYPKYINQLRGIKRDLSRYPDNIFEIIVGTQTENEGTRLCNINISGEIHDGINYKAIGSSSGCVSRVFSELWNSDMSMKQTAGIGYTAINCIIKNNRDNGVGLGGTEPKMWFVPQVGQIYHNNSTINKECREYARANITKFQKIMFG
jgi:20S proteasome alpha/beta subunit